MESTFINSIFATIGHLFKRGTVEADNMIIQMQLKQLQTHYHKVVQQQIESDYKWAAKLQTDETKQFIDKQRERQRAKAKTYNYQYSGDESEELLGAADMHMTAGGDMESYHYKFYYKKMILLQEVKY